jgi:hypothetical protein
MCAGQQFRADLSGRFRLTWPHRHHSARGVVTPNSELSSATRSLLLAESTPALLEAAYHAFESALRALRGAEDHAGSLLPAFVLAAAAAADGRDAVAAARSFPGPGPSTFGNTTSTLPVDVADQVAELALALVTRLHAAVAAGGGSPCAAAAARAGRIHELLAQPR